VSAGRAQPVFAGEAAQFRVFLDNRAPFDRPAILARHVASGAQLVLDIPAAATSEVVLAVARAAARWLPLGRVMLETALSPGPVSRLELRRARRARARLSDARALAAAAAGERRQAGALRLQAIGNEDFASLRGYQRSDSPRHVAWKAVARSGDMLTKQFSGEAAAELWLEWRQLPASLGLERRLSRLAGWVLAAERSGASYGLRLPGVEIAPRRGDGHCAACLQALALYSPP